jgi:hypothetical protein
VVEGPVSVLDEEVTGDDSDASVGLVAEASGGGAMAEAEARLRREEDEAGSAESRGEVEDEAGTEAVDVEDIEDDEERVEALEADAITDGERWGSDRTRAGSGAAARDGEIADREGEEKSTIFLPFLLAAYLAPGSSLSCGGPESPTTVVVPLYSMMPLLP